MERVIEVFVDRNLRNVRYLYLMYQYVMKTFPGLQYHLLSSSFPCNVILIYEVGQVMNHEWVLKQYVFTKC